MLILVLIFSPTFQALCTYGTTSSNPGNSCLDIVNVSPSCFGTSGFYWIQCYNMTSAVQVYCEMETLQGGWIRIASEVFTSGSSCCCGWVQVTIQGTTFCTVADGTTQASWHIDNICPYSEIRGYVSLSQRGASEGFHETGTTIDSNYVDGISFTYGASPNRQHIFSYGAANDVANDANGACACQDSQMGGYEKFMLWDFMCDSGYSTTNSYIYDPSMIAPRILFSGSDCPYTSGCCSRAGTPWFYKSLPATVNENIEVRILCDELHVDELILVRELGLYVR